MPTIDEVRAASVEYFNGDELAADVFATKYALVDRAGDYKETTPDQMHHRMAREFARIEQKYDNPLDVEEIYSLFKDFRFIVPQGSPMSGVGNPYQIQSVSNCFVIPSPEDSYGGILKTDQELVQIAKRRGGVGLDVSTLRPKGMITSNCAKTTDGIGVFMQRFSNSCREVAQNGRRGALMMTVSCHHPEIMAFIGIKRDKTKVTGANISVRWSDEFLEAAFKDEQVQLRWPVDEKEKPQLSMWVDAKPIWDAFVEANHASAEPGALFWDRILSMSPSQCYADVGFGTVSTNPCITGDTLIAVADGRGEVPIKELADSGRDVPVYAVDNAGKICVRTMRRPRLTGTKKQIYKVTLDDGSVIRCTGNHKLRCRDSSYQRVDELSPGASLHIGHRELRQISDRSSDYYWLSNCEKKSRKSEHRLIWENAYGSIPHKHVIHHVDFNSKNNNLENLRCMTQSEHSLLHGQHMLGDKNPIHALLADPIRASAYRKKMSDSTKGLKNGNAFRATNQQIRDAACVLTKQLGRRFSSREWNVHARNNQLPTTFTFYRRDELGTVYDLSCASARVLNIKYIEQDPRLVKTLQAALKQNYDADIVDNQVIVTQSCEWCKSDYVNDYFSREIAFCGTDCSNKHVNATTDTNTRRTKSLNNVYAAKGQKKCDDQCRIFNDLQFHLGRTPMLIEWVAACRDAKTSFRLKTKYGFQSWDDLKQAASTFNHKILSIELDGKEDVYSGTVDEVHNYYTVVGEGLNSAGKCSKLLISQQNCGEIVLSPYDSCRLMVLNIKSYIVDPFTPQARFDAALFGDHVRKAQRLMDDLVDIEIEQVDKILGKVECDPEPDDVKAIERNLWLNVRDRAARGRRTGLGVTAIGDAVAAAGFVYGSEESIAFVEGIYKELAVNAYWSSTVLAEERGAFPEYNAAKEKGHPFVDHILGTSDDLKDRTRLFGRRNIALLTTAPAGSVSCETQTTSGIENTYLLELERFRKLTAEDEDTVPDRVDDSGDKWQKYVVHHKGLQEWMDITGETDITKSPYHGATADDVNWVQKVKMQAAAQEWICHSISNTTNVPREATVELINEIYKTGWESGCKGITIYREGSRDPVLQRVGSENNDEELRSHQAPKRPLELSCDIKFTRVKQDNWVILVGLMNGRPYEVMGGKTELVEIPKSCTSGVLIKNSRKTVPSRYDLRLGENGHSVYLKNIVRLFDNPEHSAFTRVISLALRHGADIKFVVEQLMKDKDSDMFSFAKSISRALKTYIKDGEEASDKTCESCKADALVYMEGCLSCQACGWSKCG